MNEENVACERFWAGFRPFRYPESLLPPCFYEGARKGSSGNWDLPSLSSMGGQAVRRHAEPSHQMQNRPPPIHGAKEKNAVQSGFDPPERVLRRRNGHSKAS
jgi:hypothetical protein